jgi:hypothetical protein
MYAYVVNNAWQQWSSQDMASFLREVGTPILKQSLEDTSAFHEASGFYVFIEEGWAVRFNAQLFYNKNDLSALLDKMNI